MTAPKAEEPTVTITVAEYESLNQSANWLSMLENAGVDNWEGYSYAYELKEQAIADGEYEEGDFP